MTQVWYLDESWDDYTDECHFDPPRYLPIEELKTVTGVEISKIGIDNFENNVKYKQMKKEHGIKYEDILELSGDTVTAEEFEKKLKEYFTEHLHDDDEIRLFLDGSGYFDVKDAKENWIRVHATKGDLLFVPGGIYHRFNLGKGNYVKIRRLFSESPFWIAKFRPEADSDPARLRYLKNHL